VLPATIRPVLRLAVAPGWPFDLGPRFVVAQVFLPSFGGQQPTFPHYPETPSGGRFWTGLLLTGKPPRRAFGVLVSPCVPDVDHFSWSAR